MRRGVMRRVIGITLVGAAIGLVSYAGRGALLAMAPTGWIAEAGAQAPPPLDYFQCYQAKEAPDFPRFTSITNINTVDPFGEWLFDALKPLSLCAPADVDGSD